MSFLRYDTMLATVIATMSAGCTFSPWEFENFANTRTAIPFEGCSTSANSPVTISTMNAAAVINPALLVYAPLASTHSASSLSYTDSSGGQWFCWSVSATIPQSQWWLNPPSGTAISTYVRVLDGGNPTYIYGNDPKQCPNNAGLASLTGSPPCAFVASGLQPPRGGSFGNLNTAGTFAITASAQ